MSAEGVLALVQKLMQLSTSATVFDGATALLGIFFRMGFGRLLGL